MNLDALATALLSYEVKGEFNVCSLYEENEMMFIWYLNFLSGISLQLL